MSVKSVPPQKGSQTLFKRVKRFSCFQLKWEGIPKNNCAICEWFRRKATRRQRKIPVWLPKRMRVHRWNAIKVTWNVGWSSRLLNLEDMHSFKIVYSSMEWHPAQSPDIRLTNMLSPVHAPDKPDHLTLHSCQAPLEFFQKTGEPGRAAIF